MIELWDMYGVMILLRFICRLDFWEFVFDLDNVGIDEVIGSLSMCMFEM